MIFIGYQGIGKSTLSSNNVRFIDLESGNFWIDGKRSEDWYKPYCNIAEDLSKNGYNVFVASHKVIRDRLKNSSERVIAIIPSVSLKQEWIEKLRIRWVKSKLDKDFKAFMNAANLFEQNILEVEEDISESIILNTMNYSLYLEISRYLDHTKIE